MTGIFTMPVLEDTVLDNLLSYILSARDSLSGNQIVVNALAFYKSDIILKSKDVIFGFSGERPPKRKSYAAHPNPSTADLEDILTVFEKSEAGKFNLPNFVSHGYNSMPPSDGFDSLAAVLCSLRDEVAALRFQTEEVKINSEKDMKALDNVGCMAQDISELKLLVHGLPNWLKENSSNGINSSSSVQNTPTEASSDSSGEVQQTFTPSLFSRVVDPTVISTSDQNVDQNLNNDAGFVTVNNKRGRGGRRHRGATHNVRAGGSGINRQDAPNNRRNNSDHRSNGGERSASQLRRGEMPSTRTGSRRKNIIGTGSSSEGISTGSRVLDVFLGGCGLDTTEESINNYLDGKGVTILKCETINSRSEWHKCYKVSASPENRVKLLEAELWPQGIFVGKYYKPKSSQI